MVFRRVVCKFVQAWIFLPFAGRYILAGKKSILNSQRAISELEDTYEYFTSDSKINQQENQCVILNSKSSFDIDLGLSSAEYTPINIKKKEEYIENVLKKRNYDYEEDKNLIKSDEVENLISRSFNRF